jgi:hypothetical protein
MAMGFDLFAFICVQPPETPSYLRSHPLHPPSDDASPVPPVRFRFDVSLFPPRSLLSAPGWLPPSLFLDCVLLLPPSRCPRALSRLPARTAAPAPLPAEERRRRGCPGRELGSAAATEIPGEVSPFERSLPTPRRGPRRAACLSRWASYLLPGLPHFLNFRCFFNPGWVLVPGGEVTPSVPAGISPGLGSRVFSGPGE